MKRDRYVLDEMRNALEGVEDRKAKVERVADLIRSSGSHRWVGIYEVVGGEIAVIAWSGQAEPAHPRFPAGEGLCGAAVRSATTVVVGDVAKDPRYLTTFDNTRSEIVVPISDPATGTPLGVIDVESERLNAFKDDDRAFLEACACALARLWR